MSAVLEHRRLADGVKVVQAGCGGADMNDGVAPDMCVTYGYTCNAGDTNCTGPGKMYICSFKRRPRDGLDLCGYIRSRSSDPDSVVCCYTPLCNAPAT
mmetsp:Transcript_88945/g.238360  ORF Transcript_88945/g.238360 Transcript_88945/m.238360 type:complete len:98 (-) Transcript_88945:43-336(-)